MQQAVAASRIARLPSSNGNGHAKIKVIQKRDGSEVPYDKAKIERAIYHCFVNSNLLPATDITLKKAVDVATQVDRLLLCQPQPITVERIQDLVETQLMASGHYDAAREYILYREERRKQRRVVNPQLRQFFVEGCAAFDGPNRDIQLFQAFDKFARFDYGKGRREVWEESVLRVVNYTREHIATTFGGEAIGPETWTELQNGLLHLQAAPAMRLVQMAGPSLKRCQTGVYNCSFQFLREPQDLAEEMYLLCQGCGVGFSVEAQHAVDHWPSVRKQRSVKPDTFVIPDTTEGWCDALRTGVERWLDGGDLAYDPSQIRPKGAPLRTKGGRASGPQPLIDCLKFVRGVIFNRQNRHLTSLDLHDIACHIHRVSGVGGVRRASGISLSDLDDEELRHCKSGPGWRETNPQRDQANNSAVYNEKPTAIEFMEEWLALGKSGTGERGIFNRGSLKKQFPHRRQHGRHVYGTNPCGEIIMRHKQFCNLSIAVIRAVLDWLEVRRRVVQATIWGTLQSTMTNFKYIGSAWKQNCEEERLLGVDLLGHLDHPMLRPGAHGLAARLQELRDLAVQTNREWAAKLGINASAAVTCGKPGGDSGVFFDCAPGFKAWHGQYFLRRARFMPGNPIGEMLRAQGVPCLEDPYKNGQLVLEFPCVAPEGALILGGQSALEQLEHWKMFKVHYCEHNPSVTIYVKPEEWIAVGHWVYENWDIVGGLSFLPFDGGHHVMMPFEEISAEEYQQRKANFPQVDWSLITTFEHEDMTTCAKQYACTGDRCELI